MIGCLRTRVRKQPIIALYFEFENELKFYNLEARSNFSLSSYPRPYLVYASNGGSGESAHVRRPSCAFASRQGDKYRNVLHWPND